MLIRFATPPQVMPLRHAFILPCHFGFHWLLIFPLRYFRQLFSFSPDD
jgi:hypothetical protein